MQAYPNEVRIHVTKNGWRIMILDQNGVVAACHEMALGPSGATGTSKGDVIDKLESGFPHLKRDYELSDLGEALDDEDPYDIARALRELTEEFGD